MTHLKSSFGSVKIRGIKYEHDIVVHVNGEVSERKKKLSKDLKPLYGHTPLSERELKYLAKEKPEVVYVGTGYDSALPITPKAQKMLGEYETVILPTPEIIEKLEKEKRKNLAIIHVTC